MYNRYRGNSGHVERVEEWSDRQDAPPLPRPVSAPPPGEIRPLSPLSGLSGELGRLLGKFTGKGMETEDLLLIAVLYLLYRESGDEEFLFAIGGLLLL